MTTLAVQLRRLRRGRGRPIRTSIMGVQAGFPSPAQDYVTRALSLDEELVPDKTSGFVLRAAGDSMIHAGIFDGDLLVIDRSIDAQPGDVVIAIVDGELTVKRLARSSGGVVLQAENPAYPSIPLLGDQELVIWGVVTYSVHRQHR